MKALILNSGLGTRMGEITSSAPKCMTEISQNDTILSRQIKMLAAEGITEIVMTTGAFDDVLTEYCKRFEDIVSITFVKNERYRETNYIYSVYCAKEYLNDDILLLHGDLVFEYNALRKIIDSSKSCMAISTSLPLPEKDFKAVTENGRIVKIGIEFFEGNTYAAQPLYKLLKNDLKIWLDKISVFCENGQDRCYAENAFNEVSAQCNVYGIDIREMLCNEIDDPNDLAIMKNRIEIISNRTVYMCFSTDIIHSGHISIIKNAVKLGRLIIGVMTDEVVCSYKHFPMLPFTERKMMFENISGVYKVVAQTSLSYKENLERFRPDYVVHGDDWVKGPQRIIRDEVISYLSSYGGKLVEFPYSADKKYQSFDASIRESLSLPDNRRSRLKKILAAKKIVTAIEAHSGITGLIAEKTVVYQNGGARQFDAMWISSLCDSTAKGKPDIELVDMTSRFRTIDDIMEVTTKPIIFDGDTGGLIEHFVYTVKTLERIGVSMVIIEDKTGLKKNSLFGTDVEQTQDSIENFCAKINAGKKAQKTPDFMICARIESLILEAGIEDALNRAFAYVKAGADAIMIHSRRKTTDEIFEFVDKFREKNKVTPIVVVPTSFNTVTEEELSEKGVNIVIYANQLTRTGFPAMQKAAQTILEYHRAKECDEMCMSINDIITLIPEE